MCLTLMGHVSVKGELRGNAVLSHETPLKRQNLYLTFYYQDCLSIEESYVSLGCGMSQLKGS